MAQTVAERQAKSRAKHKAHLAAVFGRRVDMDWYKGTCADADFLKAAGGFEQDAELVAILIKNATIMLKRDMSQREKLLGLPRRGQV